MEPVETLADLVEQGAFGLDRSRERFGNPFRVVAGVRLGALGEQDPHQRSRPLPLGRRGERRRGDLVGREPGRSRPAEHLGHDPGEGFRTAALGRPIGDVGPGPVAARDIAGIGQPLVDRPDRVGVDPEGCPELPDRCKAGTGQQPSGVDLVGDLPVDLGGDGDVRIALDVQVSGGSRERAVGRGQLARWRDLRVT